MPELVDDRYEVLEVIASGGMATVWRAHDRRLDRQVAIKRPHPAPPDDPVRTRIEREAKAAASLNHPNLVTIYDAGRDESGPFLVMELVEGPSLAAAATGMDRAEAIQTCSRVADALAVVHAVGIVHRDVKPSNILISPRGPLLTDFGIALDGDVTSQLTRTGTVMATVDYAAPEQLAGEQPGPKSDVFSLAVILYELVAGRLPFTGTDRRTPPPPLGDRHLDPVLAAAMALEPDDRPDADTLARRLRSSAPTAMITGAGGSTMPIDIPELQETPRTAPAAEDVRTAGFRPWLLGAGALSLVLAVALALADLGPTTAARDTETTVDAPSTTARVTTSAAPSTAPSGTAETAPTTAVPTTEPLDVPDAREALEAALSQAEPRDLNPGDIKGLMERADRAIGAAAEGDQETAGKELREIAKKIDEKLEGEVRQQSLGALVGLADALDISLDG